jgi:hypothetical protein
MQLTSVTNLETALSYLEDRGFVNKQQNIILLKRSNFDPEIVANFLITSKAFRLDDKTKVLLHIPIVNIADIRCQSNHPSYHRHSRICPRRNQVSTYQRRGTNFY